MKRRAFLAASGAALAAHLTGCGGGNEAPMEMAGRMGGGTAGGGTVAPAGGGVLPIPALMTGSQFDLRLQRGVSEFLAGKATPTYGINANFLGPAIKVRAGETITLNVTNALTEPSAIHWHGMHLPAVMDGGAHQTMAPGATWRPSFVVRQKAGTNWFHPHTLGETGRQVYMGLAGLMIVEDADSDRAGLPQTWGEDDILLILQDRRFAADGQFAYLTNPMPDLTNGMMGDTLLVNGAIAPRASLPAKEVRFRLLNGSNARVYRVAFADGRSFSLIASDNAFLDAPVAVSNVILSPGERAEIVADFGAARGSSVALIDTLSGATLASMAIDKSPSHITKLPDQLATLERLAPASALRTRVFTLAMGMGGMGGMGVAGSMGMLFTINGRTMDMARIDHSLKLNEVEIWEIRNPDMGMTHSFHVHGTHFTLLDRNGSAANLRPHERGYKDTVMLSGGDTVRIILRMTDYVTNADAPYMFHCHILEHEDAGMMGQFIVS